MPLRTSAKGGCQWKIARIENEYAEDIWAPFFLISIFLRSFNCLLFFFKYPFELRWVRGRSVMFGEVEYDDDTRCQCSRYSCAMFRTKEESHQTEERGSNYGPSERRASYVNMKSLANGWIRIVRNDAEKNVQREKFSQRATSKGAQRRRKKEKCQLYRTLCTRREFRKNA